VTVEFDHKIPYPIYESNLIDETEPWHHDAGKLASVLMNLYQERTGPLAENGHQ
jgi:hypothetical protein